MQAYQIKWLLMGAGAALLSLLASGCASQPRQVSVEWEWYEMSTNYPYPPPPAKEMQASNFGLDR